MITLTSRNVHCHVLIALPIFVVFSAACNDHLIDADGPAYSNVTPLTGAVVYTEDRFPCDDNNPQRNLYFGDLHVHTARSFDAYAYDVRTSSDDAWRFARGEEVLLPPLDPDGVGTRAVRLSDPLDFAAITDHQEFIGEVELCTTPGSANYDTPLCEDFRRGGEEMAVQFGYLLTSNEPERFSQICGDNDAHCVAAATAVWGDIVNAAQLHNDDTRACRFSAFAAYEYTTSTPNLANNHRNVIFRNGEVPALPPSFFEEQDEVSLWDALSDTCLDQSGRCDFIAIPHNTNWSNGNMFVPENNGLTVAEQADAAAFRAQMEPLIEIVQHKGDMEASNGFAGVATDPLADFEKIYKPGFDDCGEGTGVMGIAGAGCVSRYDFMRGILGLGMREMLRIGVNPYPLGVIGSTDTHNGTPGFVDEDSFAGHVGLADDTPAKRLGPATATHNVSAYNPGGIVGAWSVENSRDALFEAFRRREVFATSGPRISVRLFGGWTLPSEMCGTDNFVATGYDRGVPMGGTLPVRVLQGRAPVFAVQAIAAPGEDATPLQRVQIIRVRVTAAGDLEERIFEVAGNPQNGASVDRRTCERNGSGEVSLCAVWTDPDFDPAIPATYYARAVENPSCSWRQRDCNTFAEDDPIRPPGCDLNPEYEMVIQERAVTSPIRYIPE